MMLTRDYRCFMTILIIGLLTNLATSSFGTSCLTSASVLNEVAKFIVENTNSEFSTNNGESNT